MNDKAGRKALIAQYKENPPEAGIYRFVNGLTGETFLGADTDLKSVAGKVDFARLTGTLSVLAGLSAPPGALEKAVRQHGLQHFTLEVLDRVPVKPDTTSQELREELETLRTLWQEKLNGN